MRVRRILSIVIATFILFAVGLFVWSAVNPIITNESIFKYHWTDILAGLITLYFLPKLFKKLKEQWHDLIVSLRQIFIIISYVIAVPFIVKVFFEQSVPRFLHALSSEQTTKKVIVKDKISLRRCINGVELEGYSFVNGRICNISSQYYSKVNRGTELTIKGQSSYFGFTTESVTFTPKNEKEPDIDNDDWKTRSSKNVIVL